MPVSSVLHHRAGLTARAAAMILAVGLAAGCTGSDDDATPSATAATPVGEPSAGSGTAGEPTATTTAASPAPSTTGAGPSAPAAEQSVAVNAFEFGYAVDVTEMPAGEVTFTLTNGGGMDHDLVLEGVPGAATELIGPTESDSFTVTLEPGTYTLFCSVSGHRGLGMEFEITVT